jgi:TetR/AcrR family transcriptional regulator, cholesterol catabolism regulator
MSKREREIIAAAAAIFKEKGYQAATTRDIAAAVGIQQATLYYYVKSKEELLYLVVREPIERLYMQVESILHASLPARDKIEQAIGAHVAAFDDNYPHMLVFVQEMHNVVQALRDRLRDFPRRYQNLWEAILCQGVTAGELRSELDITATALMILGMCNWMFRWYRKGGRLDAATLAKQYADAILDGLTARPAG